MLKNGKLVLKKKEKEFRLKVNCNFKSNQTCNFKSNQIRRLSKKNRLLKEAKRSSVVMSVGIMGTVVTVSVVLIVNELTGNRISEEMANAVRMVFREIQGKPYDFLPEKRYNSKWDSSISSSHKFDDLPHSYEVPSQTQIQTPSPLQIQGDSTRSEIVYEPVFQPVQEILYKVVYKPVYKPVVTPTPRQIQSMGYPQNYTVYASSNSISSDFISGVTFGILFCTYVVISLSLIVQRHLSNNSNDSNDSVDFMDDINLPSPNFSDPLNLNPNKPSKEKNEDLSSNQIDSSSPIGNKENPL